MKRNRRSIRLKEYDYGEAGAYFVTICTQHKECLFGDIGDGEMGLNEAGKMVVQWYRELENKFPHIKCDTFVCMPNHIHFIVINTGVRKDVGADLRVCPDSTHINPNKPGRRAYTGEHVGADLRVCPNSTHINPNKPGGRAYTGEHTGSPLPNSTHSHPGKPGGCIYLGEHAGSPLPDVVQWFKTMSTNAYIRGVKQYQWPSFPGKLWQRNYYEHVIRNEKSCNKIREYIMNNPAQWHFDHENPDVTAPANESEFAALFAEVQE